MIAKLNARFSSQKAFITGAGSGLGAAFAHLLLKNGWTLYLGDINETALKQYQDIDDVFTFQLDVSDKLSFERVATEVYNHTDHIDLLINNAGIGDGELFRNYKIEHWERMIEINLMGTYYGTHFLLPLISGQKDGMIINIGSVAGFMNMPGMSAYNVSKAAVHSFSESLSHELADSGIQVSVAMPGFFETNIMDQAKGSSRFVDFAKKQMKYSKTNAEEMAQVILSEAARGITKIIYPKDAGRNHWVKKWFPSLIRKEYRRLMVKFDRE